MQKVAAGAHCAGSLQVELAPGWDSAQTLALPSQSLELHVAKYWKDLAVWHRCYCPAAGERAPSGSHNERSALEHLREHVGPLSCCPPPPGNALLWDSHSATPTLGHRRRPPCCPPPSARTLFPGSHSGWLSLGHRQRLPCPLSGELGCWGSCSGWPSLEQLHGSFPRRPQAHLGSLQATFCGLRWLCLEASVLQLVRAAAALAQRQGYPRPSSCTTCRLQPCR